MNAAIVKLPAITWKCESKFKVAINKQKFRKKHLPITTKSWRQRGVQNNWKTEIEIFKHNELDC